MIGTLAAIVLRGAARAGCWMWGHDWQRDQVDGFDWTCLRCGLGESTCW